MEGQLCLDRPSDPDVIWTKNESKIKKVTVAFGFIKSFLSKMFNASLNLKSYCGMAWIPQPWKHNPQIIFQSCT